jgi:hypothetical protein
MAKTPTPQPNPFDLVAGIETLEANLDGLAVTARAVLQRIQAEALGHKYKEPSRAANLARLEMTLGELLIALPQH